MYNNNGIAEHVSKVDKLKHEHDKLKRKSNKQTIQVEKERDEVNNQYTSGALVGIITRGVCCILVQDSFFKHL